MDFKHCVMDKQFYGGDGGFIEEFQKTIEAQSIRKSTFRIWTQSKRKRYRNQKGEVIWVTEKLDRYNQASW